VPALLSTPDSAEPARFTASVPPACTLTVAAWMAEVGAFSDVVPAPMSSVPLPVPLRALPFGHGEHAAVQVQVGVELRRVVWRRVVVGQVAVELQPQRAVAAGDRRVDDDVVAGVQRQRRVHVAGLGNGRISR
jgi:hypothetical protein